MTKGSYKCVFSLGHTLDDNPSVNGGYDERELCNLRKFTIPDETIGRCRFCGKSKPVVTFNKKAHSVSEFLGNKLILSDNECDSCNIHFSQSEAELSKYLMPYNMLYGIRGKNGIPSHKTKDRCGYISAKNCLDDFTPDNDHYWLFGYQDGLGESIFNIDKKKQTVTFQLERQSYIPALVYKCLVKFALSLLPSQYLVHFKDSLDGLLAMI